jgi:hypothetical protein
MSVRQNVHCTNSRAPGNLRMNTPQLISIAVILVMLFWFYLLNRRW